MTRKDDMVSEVARMRVDTELGGFMVEATGRGLRAITPIAMTRGKGAGAIGKSAPAFAPARHEETPDLAPAPARRPAESPPPAWLDSEAPAHTPARHHAEAAADALRRYAEGVHARYDGPLDVAAPPLHLAVWRHLRSIPFGGTTTYGAIATALGLPGEARAVGTAVGANPACVLVPCHRVVGADGSLRGFAWGLDLKRRLLAHEGSGALSLFADAAERQARA